MLEMFYNIVSLDRNTKDIWVPKVHCNVSNSACTVMTKLRYICAGQAFVGCKLYYIVNHTKKTTIVSYTTA